MWCRGTGVIELRWVTQMMVVGWSRASGEVVSRAWWRGEGVIESEAQCCGWCASSNGASGLIEMSVWRSEERHVTRCCHWVMWSLCCMKLHG